MNLAELAVADSRNGAEVDSAVSAEESLRTAEHELNKTCESARRTVRIAQLQRQLTLDETIGPEASRHAQRQQDDSEGMFDWIAKLREIDDEKLRRIIGTDAALYVIFLRYSSLFFGYVSLANLALMVLYMTGDPTDDDNFRLDQKHTQHAMQAATVLNVSNSPVKVSIAFIYSVVVVAGLAFCFVLRYLSLFKSSKDALEEDIVGLINPEQVKMIDM